VAGFAGSKFVGYSLTVSGLKKLQPVVASAATKIAAFLACLTYPARSWHSQLLERSFSVNFNGHPKDE
jgi:hypothetical protein